MQGVVCVCVWGGGGGTVLVTWFHTAVEKAVSGVHKLRGTDGVPASLTLLFWRWLTVFTGQIGR